MTAKPKKPQVDLTDMRNFAGLIVPYSSGVIYRNTVRSNGCQPEEVEGFFIPLSSSSVVETEPLSAALEKRGWPWDINDEAADYLDDLFEHYDIPKRIKLRVDRSRVSGARKDGRDADKLEDSHEAWVWVTFSEPEERSPMLSAMPHSIAILTWKNSD